MLANPLDRLYDHRRIHNLRFSFPPIERVYNKSTILSVSTGLTSSGIHICPLRTPASKCATGIHDLAPTGEQAIVKFTFPTTIT